MKKFLFMLALILGLGACSKNADNNTAENNQDKNKVEVLYFHGKKRCATCIAIEENTKEVIENLFAEELKNGTVEFKTVDISTPEGEELADKYEVTWSSLYVNGWKDGKEHRNDMTEFAFTNARSNPELFKNTLSEKIRQEL